MPLISKRATPKKRILMIVAPKDFWEKEYFAPRQLFNDEGFDVHVASGEKHAVGTQGTEIAASLVSEQDQADYDGLFVVGGKGMIDFSDDANAQRLLRKFLRAKKPVALVCHGPLLAAKTKAVAGKDITGWPEIRKDMEKAGGKWTGMPIERDGFVFTAVGPDDAEDLAFALVSAIRGDKMLARSEARLDDEAAMRKLAAIHYAADLIASAADEDDIFEVLKELAPLEEEEFESTAPAPPKAEQPQRPAPSTPAQPPEPPEVPQPQQQGAPPRHGVFSFKPPRSDGQWPDDPGAPPPGFPFAAEDFANEETLTALFQQPETWDKLQGVSEHPAKMSALQDYLVPKVVLLVGKDWWERNKRRGSLKGAPFGIFDAGFVKGKTSEVLDYYGRGYIAAINWHVADLLGRYLSTKGAGPQQKIVGYIYQSLHNRLVMEAAKTHGFSIRQPPACGYCRWKAPKVPPPVLKKQKTHYKGKRGRPIFECPRCADLLETQRDLLMAKENDIERLEQSIAGARDRMADAKRHLADNPDDDDARMRIQRYSEMESEFARQLDSVRQDRKSLSEDVWKRERLVNVPYQHLVCINPDCPGVKIPLTFVDWSDKEWQKGPIGERRKEMLKSMYGIEEPSPDQQEVDDSSSKRKGGVEPPPKWMWNIPFICPFDGARFTPAEAFGKGHQGKGGLLGDPPRTNIWHKPYSLSKRFEETGVRTEEVRRQTGIGRTTDSPESQSDRAESMFYKDMSDSIRQELYRRKEEHAKEMEPRAKGGRSRRLFEMQQLLYDAALEWSLLNPVEMGGYFAGRQVQTVKVYDKETGEIKDHREISKMSHSGAARIVASIIQRWFARVIQREDGIDMLKPWLTQEAYDGIPPDCYFLSTVKQMSGDALSARCHFKYGKGSPIGEANPRGTSYGKAPNVALLLGAWKYPNKPSKKDMMTPIGPDDGASMTADLKNLNNVVTSYDYNKIMFDASHTDLKQGDAVIMRALFMPRHTAWRPVKLVMHLRKDMEEDLWGIMEIIGRLADGNENDEKLFARWRRKMRQLGVPARLEEFDRALRREKE